jgi:hypothetical protein
VAFVDLPPGAITALSEAFSQHEEQLKPIKTMYWPDFLRTTNATKH